MPKKKAPSVVDRLNEGVAYIGVINLGEHTTLGEADELRDKLREVGSADLHLEDRLIEFTIEADDLWDLYELLDGLKPTFHDYHYEISKDAVNPAGTHPTDKPSWEDTPTD